MSSNSNKLEITGYDDKEKLFLVKSAAGQTVKVSDTFAEMFPLWVGRVLITAQNEKWAQIAGSITTGFATSVIAASAEASIERAVPADQTPDKRARCTNSHLQPRPLRTKSTNLWHVSDNAS